MRFRISNLTCSRLCFSSLLSCCLDSSPAIDSARDWSPFPSPLCNAARLPSPASASSPPVIEAPFPLRCPPSFSGVGFLSARDRSPFFRSAPLSNTAYLPSPASGSSPFSRLTAIGTPLGRLYSPRKQNSGTTTVAQHSSSIALLQERFRQLQRVKEMREEREQLRLFVEPDEIGPTNRCEPSSLSSTLFFHPELIRLSIRHQRLNKPTAIGRYRFCMAMRWDTTVLTASL
ncbi:hypothetical protein ACLOJK_005722 [Asimina triloba]